MIKPKVYLSGGFKTNWQRKVIDSCQKDFIFFNPRTHKLKHSDFYTAWDIHFIKQCDILFAYMEEENPSGYGLALELGIAFALNKTIILVDEKSKIDHKFGRYFAIVHKTANIVFSNLDEGIKFLKKFKIEY